MNGNVSVSAAHTDERFPGEILWEQIPPAGREKRPESLTNPFFDSNFFDLTQAWCDGCVLYGELMSNVWINVWNESGVVTIL